MSNGFDFDQALAQRIEAVYMTSDAARRRKLICDALELRSAEQVLDIGTGPGFLAREMASLVGPAGRVVGLDTSAPMLELAKYRCAAIPWVELQQGDAAQLSAPDPLPPLGFLARRAGLQQRQPPFTVRGQTSQTSLKQDHRSAPPEDSQAISDH